MFLFPLGRYSPQGFLIDLIMVSIRLPNLVLWVSIIALFFSLFAFTKSILTNKRLVSIQEQVLDLNKRSSELQTQIVHLTKHIDSSLESINVHLAFIEKYAQSEYYSIYGNVGQISNTSDAEKVKTNKVKSK